MEIIRRDRSIEVAKPSGTTIRYYLFDEYELHYNEIAPGTTQDWHSHDILEEALYIISGTLLAEWIEDGERHSALLEAGDMIRSEQTVHTFTNTSDAVTTFIVLKMVLTGTNQRETFKRDKRTFPLP